MTVDYMPAPAGRMGAEVHHDPYQARERRDDFDDPANPDYPPSRERDHLDGYWDDARDMEDDVDDVAFNRSGSRYDGPRYEDHDDPMPADDAIAAWMAERRWGGTRSRASVAALTAAVVVGTGISAGVFGIAPLIHPGSTPHDATAPRAAAAPSTRTVHRNAPPGRHHTGYVGKHRRPLSSQTGPASPAGSVVAPSSAGGSAPSSAPSVPGTSHQPHTNPPPSPSPPPPSSGSGNPGAGGHRPPSGGLIGGILGGVTGIVGGLGL